MQPSVSVEQLAQMAFQLSPEEEFDLVQRILTNIRAMSFPVFQENTGLHSAYGICADLQPVPSKQDIADLRQEIFHNFPREDL